MEKKISYSNIDLIGDIVRTMGKKKSRLSLLWEGFSSRVKGQKPDK